MLLTNPYVRNINKEKVCTLQVATGNNEVSGEECCLKSLLKSSLESLDFLIARYKKGFVKSCLHIKQPNPV